MKVLGAEVARVMRSMAARGEEADFVRARKGCRMVNRSIMNGKFGILLPMRSELSFVPCLKLGVSGELFVGAISLN